MIRYISRGNINFDKLSSICVRRSSTVVEKQPPIQQSSTVDQNEIKNFKNLVNNWWDEQGEMKPLHSMNMLRVPFIRDGLQNQGLLKAKNINTSFPLKGIKILEVGCGGGILSEPLARLGADVTGLDACKDLIETAKLHAKSSPELSNNLKYIFSTIEDYSEDNPKKFDAIVTSECVEHVQAKKTFLKSCADSLKPGGSIFVTTLNKTTLSWIFGIVVAENVLNLVPKGTHDWDKFISPQEVQKILEHYNCTTILLHGLTYNFLCNSWFWIPDTSVNYALHAVKLS